jgi:hypothetical protein
LQILAQQVTLPTLEIRLQFLKDLQVCKDFFGSFTAKLQVFDGTTLLGTVTEAGTSTSNGDGKAIFIGAKDQSGPNITKVVFSIVGSNDFAIDTLPCRTFRSRVRWFCWARA